MQDIFYETDNQLSTFWDVEILNSENIPKLKTRVISSTIPFLQINIERRLSGILSFKDVTFPEEFSITLRESSNFTVYKFFKEWISKFYNEEENTFKTFESKTAYLQNLLNLKFTFYRGNNIALGVGTGIEGVEFKKDTMEESFSFYAKNCKPIGFNNIDLQYDSGSALEITINMIAEQVTQEK